MERFRHRSWSPRQRGSVATTPSRVQQEHCSMSVLCSASVGWSTLLLLILSGASASNITFCEFRDSHCLRAFWGYLFPFCRTEFVPLWCFSTFCYCKEWKKYNMVKYIYITSVMQELFLLPLLLPPPIIMNNDLLITIIIIIMKRRRRRRRRRRTRTRKL